MKRRNPSFKINYFSTPHHEHHFTNYLYKNQFENMLANRRSKKKLKKYKNIKLYKLYYIFRISIIKLPIRNMDILAGFIYNF